MKYDNRICSGILLSSLICLLGLSSCKKDNDKSAISDVKMQEIIGVVGNHQAVTQPFTDAYGVMFSQFDDLAASIARIQNGRNEEATRVFGDDCYQVHISPENILQWPKTVTWSYQDCQGQDGKVRYGSVITTFSEPFYTPGATATTTFEGYSIDSVMVSGTLTYTNQFSYTNDDTIYAIKVDFSNAKTEDMQTGFWSEVNGSLTYQLVKKSGYFDLLSPFTTSGTLTAHNSIGFSWTAETTVPVLRDFACLWPKSGIITFHWNNSEQASIDYGDGNCDNKAEISYRGFNKAIFL